MKPLQCSNCGLIQNSINTHCKNCSSKLNVKPDKTLLNILQLSLTIIITVSIIGLGFLYRFRIEERMAKTKAETDKYYSFLDSTPDPQQSSEERFKQFNSPEGRTKFVAVLQTMVEEDSSMKQNTTFTVSGTDNTTLVLNANDVNNYDCSIVANGEYGKTASKGGFDKLFCKNRKTNNVYTFYLNP